MVQAPPAAPRPRPGAGLGPVSQSLTAAAPKDATQGSGRCLCFDKTRARLTSRPLAGGWWALR